MRLFFFTVLCLCSVAVNAATVTIDFEELPEQYLGGSGTVLSKGYEISGYTTGLFGPGDMGIVTGQNGTLVFSGIAEISYSQDSFGPGVNYTISREDDTAFAIYSLDLLATGPTTVGSITGTKAGGGYVFGTSDSLFGTGDWLNVTSVSLFIQGDGFTYCCQASGELDNIVVGAAVPVPAAVWLFGSALAGLGWMRRKQGA
jgi:hypothetical protein